MFYLFLLAHLVADFALQPYRLVIRKRYYYGLAIHCGIVLGCMLLLGLLDPTALVLWPAMLAITAVHFVADWWKVRHGQRVPGPAIVPFLLDQMIHIGTLVVALSLSLPTEQVWSLAASPAALLAVCVAGLIVALLATPIAVMVWLDPAFAQQALAGQARLRAIGVGSVALALAVWGGAMALPASLLGLVIVTRKPSSAHPLDSTLGMGTVVCVAVTVGAMLGAIL
jgi:hypothetical protein